MTVEGQPREVWLGVPGDAPGTLFVDAAGRIPRRAFTVPNGDTTIGALHALVLPELGLAGPVLDCMLDVPGDFTPDMLVAAFVTVEPPGGGWMPPDGWHAVAPAAADLGIDAGLRPLLGQWIGDLVGTRPPDAQRPKWSLPGWHDRGAAWIGEMLAAQQRGPVAHIAPVRNWGISAVLRVAGGDDRTYWFKAVCDHFRPEAPITAALAEVAPDHVAPVLAVEPDEGWLLLDDLGDGATTGDATSHASAYACLRKLQQSASASTDRLVAAGAAVRPLSALADQLAAALADPIVQPWHGASPARADELVAWVAARATDVATAGLPDVLVHGDFHPGNVATLPDGSRTIFDWSDAAIAPPFVDVATWLSWLDGDEPARRAVWTSFAEQWSDVAPVEEWLAWRPVLDGLAGAYHVICYTGIVASLDELRRPEHGVGVREFFALLDAAVPRRS